MSTQLSPPDRVAALLSGLIGKPIGVRVAPTKTASLPTALAIAVYGGEGQAAGAWLCDMASASSLAAALSLLPPAVAKEAVSAGKLDEPLLENLREIFNVGARLFQSDRHVSLKGVFLPGQALPAPVTNLLKSTKRAEFEVGVPGYANGRTWLLLP